jgi:hypothetical protein
MNKIQETFESEFSNWEIKLPAQIINEKINGYIKKNGWLIQYCFGKEMEKDYMDYYAEHRMTDPTHCRIYEDGSTKTLSCYQVFYCIEQDDPIQTEKNEKECEEHNKMVAQELLDKGFNKFTINSAILSGMTE